MNSDNSRSNARASLLAASTVRRHVSAGGEGACRSGFEAATRGASEICAWLASAELVHAPDGVGKWWSGRHAHIRADWRACGFDQMEAAHIVNRYSEIYELTPPSDPEPGRPDETYDSPRARGGGA